MIVSLGLISLDEQSPGDMTHEGSGAIRGYSLPSIAASVRDLMATASAASWIETWLSAPRLSVYLDAAGGDRERALALYEWNTSVAAAFHHDLAHLEVGLRNAYDQALCRGARPGQVHWVFESARHFPPQMHKSANGRRYDANAKSRALIEDAVKQATPRSRGAAGGDVRLPASGKVIAELSFGFWRYLSSRRQAEPLWVPYLHTAFRPGTSRHDVDGPVGRLHDLRNRVAHHEPLLATNLVARCADVLTVASLLSDELATYIGANSTCSRLVADRPY